MSAPHDLDRITEAWLAEGPTELTDRVLDAALDEVHWTRQRRPVRVPWRTRPMSNPMRLATAALVIVVAGATTFLVANALDRDSSTVAAPSLVASPIATGAAATASPDANPTSPDAALLAPLGYEGPGVIAFTRTTADAPDPTTWLVDPATGEETPLKADVTAAGGTSRAVDGCCLVLSPDGWRMAIGYGDASPGGDAVQRTAIVDLRTGSADHVPNCGGCGSLEGIDGYLPAAWSPDGNTIAAAVWSDADPSRNGIGLIRVGPKGNGGWEVETTGNLDIPVAFSPSSGELLFVRTTQDRLDRGPLFVLGIASGTVRQLSPDGVMVFADGYFGPSASWHPDGQRIAYAGTDASGSTDAMRVFIVPAAGGASIPLTEPASWITSARWSPRGAWIAFDRDDGRGRHDVVVIQADGTGERNLTAAFDPGTCCARWAPDGSALVAPATTGANDRSELVVIPIDGGEIRQVTDTRGAYTDIAWGPVKP